MRVKPVAPTRRVGSKPSFRRWSSAASIASRRTATSSSMGATMSPRSPVVVVAQGVLRQRFAQALEHAVVVHDDAAVLAGIDAVGAGDGLHQGVGLHRLVDVERAKALDIEAGQPHGADDGDAERMLRGP